MSAIEISLLVTGVAVALITGLFYSYSCSVNLGLGKLPDREYLMSMQSINREILNPVFFASFMGTLFLLPLSAFLSYRSGTYGYFFLSASAIVYLIGVFGVTGIGNVPLNEALDRFDISSATPEGLRNHRMHFEITWNKFHQIRTVACVICLVLFLLAFFKGIRGGSLTSSAHHVSAPK